MIPPQRSLVLCKGLGSSLTQGWFPTYRVTSITFCSACVFLDSFPSKDPAMLTLVNYSQRERIRTASSHTKLHCQMNPNLFQRWRRRTVGAGRAALPTSCSLWTTPLLYHLGFPPFLDQTSNYDALFTYAFRLKSQVSLAPITLPFTNQ